MKARRAFSVKYYGKEDHRKCGYPAHGVRHSVFEDRKCV